MNCPPIYVRWDSDEIWFVSLLPAPGWVRYVAQEVEPRCKNCKHWLNYPAMGCVPDSCNFDMVERVEWGTCSMTIGEEWPGGKAVSVYDDGALACRSDFGCVQFEAK